MSSRTALATLSALLLVLIAGPLSAQDWESFAAASDRSEDSLILQTLKGADLDTEIAICRGLGRRQDRNVEAALDFLTENYAPGTAARTELLLRWILAAARQAHPGEEDLAAWISDNASSTDTLMDGMSRWKSPMLKGELIALAVIARRPSSQPALMEAGDGVVKLLQATGGFLSGEDTSLAMAFLAAAERTAAPDFLPVCADIARLSREKTIVDAARSAAAAIAKAR
jgi:hypothetical protein